jgi:hypothetical protein
MTNSTDTETAASAQRNSIGVSEHIAASMLGVSLSSIRRDRRDGRLGGVPYFKLGEGKRSAVRYAAADLEQFIAERKKRGSRPVRVEVQAPAAPVTPALPAIEPEDLPEPPVERIDPPAPFRMPSRPKSPWEIMAERYAEEPEDDPFAIGRAPRRRTPGGYFSG